MPDEPTITCPNCQASIKLTESLAAPLIQATRYQYETKLKEQGEKFAARETAIEQRERKLVQEKEAVDATVSEKLEKERKRLSAETAKDKKALEQQQAELDKAREAMDATIAAKLSAERLKITEQEAKKAKLALGQDLEQKTKELAELSDILKLRDAKLAEAQKAQAELIRKQRELDDAKRELELTVEKRVQADLDKTRKQAESEAQERYALKLIEKDEKAASLQRKIEELQKKAEQGSQQLQGEALELQLESLLQQKFPHDHIDPVPKGEHGGDLLHRIHSPTGTSGGTILWETKRTKNWSDGWLVKLRDDQRQAKAEIAVIAATALPKDVESFDQIDGVWIVHPRYVLPLAMVLRQSLLEVANARQVSAGQQTKTEMIYQYLTGPGFRLRVQAIVEAFTTMEQDLAKEKKAITRQWAKRETQITNVMQATVGMYGDLQGIAGQSLQEIEGLQLENDSNVLQLENAAENDND